MKIAGLDIGTTGCKLTVFDESGSELGKSYRDYPVQRNVGGHEIDVEALMEGKYAHMVALKGDTLTTVPLEEVIPTDDMHSNFRPVDVNGELMELARTMGICFGDK